MANEFEAEMFLGIEKLKHCAFIQMFIISYIYKAICYIFVIKLLMWICGLANSDSFH